MTEKTQQYMLRIDSEKLSTDDQLFELLQTAGVAVDTEFGAVRVDPSSRYVIVRGTTTNHVIEKLKASHGIEAFVDMNIGPTPKTLEEE